MLRTFQFRLQPNATQVAMLERILADNCETANACIQERREAWKLERKSISYRHQQDELTELRKDPFFNWIACDIQRDPLRRVDRAFKAFFRRCKAGEKPGFPRFRSRHRYDSLVVGQVLTHYPLFRQNVCMLPWGSYVYKSQ
jgi:putative transposase